MLLEFGLKNFFSFKEGLTVSFKLDAKVPTAISRGRDVTTVLCVKGANASGKTNVLRGLSFLSVFAANSFAIPPDGVIPYQPHFDSTEPTEFFADFSVGNLVYRYELVLTEYKVLQERIYRTKAKRVLVLEREEEQISFATQEFKRLESLKLRKNVSIISLAHQHEFEELDAVYKFFQAMVSNVSYIGLDVEPETERSVSRLLAKNEALLEFVKTFISECDVGVTDIEIIERNTDEKDKEYFPVFVHGNMMRAITSHTESSGTKALFKNLARYKRALDRGSVLIADEFDIHLHPHILPKLIALFLDPEINKNGAQLLFTSHSSEVMEALGRYRIYLVNKQENESFGYRLDEIPGDILRNDRPISPAYNDGKIGGVPKV